MSECKKTRELCKELVGLGAEVVPYVGSRRQPSGYPDRLIWHKLWYGWIEFKDTRTKVAKLQRHRMQCLHERVSGSVFVVRFGNSYDRGTIENHEGDILGKWHSAAGLLRTLADLA